jgi:PAS domain S-box-containing protein
VSIRTKFLALFFVLSLAPLTAIGVMAYRSGRRAIEDSLGQLFELRASGAVQALGREAAELQTSGEAWTGLELMQDVLSDDPDGRISSFLVQQRQRHPMLSRAVVTDAGGRVVAASSPEWMGRKLPRAAEEEPPAWRDEPDAEAPVVTRAFPIRAIFDETRVLGHLRVSWNLAHALRRMRSDAATGLAVLRQDGVVVYAPSAPADWVLRRNLLESGSRAAARASQGATGFLVERLGGDEYLVGYAPATAVAGYSALVFQDTASAFAPAYRLRDVVLGLGAALALSAIVVSVVVSRRGSRPLLELAELARRVAAGDLDVRLEPRSSDEIGSLALSFNRMAEELHARRAQLVAKEYLDSIFSHMAEGLAVVDGSGTVTKANEALVALVGARAEEVVGAKAGTLFVEGEESFRAGVLVPATRAASVREVELRLKRRHGPPVAVTVSAGALPGDGKGVEVVCIATDITHRKLGEQALVQARESAEAGARAKAQFLATMSHEIRTPLNGVIGMTDLLAGSMLTEDQRDWVETARRSGEGLLALLNDILDVSKMDAGKLHLERIDFDLRSCLESVADVLAYKAGEKGLELALAVDPALPERVHGDPARVRQALLNLGGNAVKFTSRGHVLIRAAPAEGGRVRCSVTDTGPGVPAAVRDRLFEPFFQADASTTRRYGGTGLGLAITRQLVELMNGTVAVETEEGVGSTFSITLELPAVAEPAAPPPAPSSSLRGLRVLIVDDNATNRQVMREMLRAWGCAFEEAADAFEALDLLRETAGSSREFQIVLIDFQMPEMDGGELAVEIKGDPRLAHVPLVLVTSVPQHGDAARMMDLGFDAYLTKPLKQSVLHDAIAAVLGSRAGVRARPALSLVTAHTVEEAARARRRVLVVDDNALNVQTAVGLLARAGIECDVARSGAEAVQALAQLSYGLVLMDCDMPGMDGYEAARLIRSRESGRARTPIVAMTEPSQGSRRRWTEAGMDDSIRQPPRLDEVERVLQRYLRESR